ncbi:mitochondrial outer membrane protein porin 2-like isoform X2 [Populus nigra]|uniref:mitochondrial outer membrane protein porin 2-like isoform X2 n=1 Tax=Populus nigra TaxID=3691 RepID=UPI002B27A08F|nr:mitochondrial outer membrane protein porin 2-like isoform X2 [Populus nigra]
MSNSKYRKRRKRSAGSSKTSKVPQAPLLFSNFGKKPLDLVAEGYSKDHKFSISTCSTTGAKLTSRAVKRGRLSTASVAAQYKYKDATINVIVDSKSPISTTLTLSRKFLPSLNTSASLKLPKYDSSTTKYEIASRQFREIDAGFSMTKPNYDASITMGNKGDFLRASYIHYFDHKKKVAAAAVISHRFSKKENALTVGGSWIMDNITTVKARVDDRGKIMMLLQYGIISKSCLTIASEFDTKSLNKIPGIGLAFSLVL